MPSAIPAEIRARPSSARRVLSAAVRAARPFVVRHGAALSLLALGLGMIAARGPLPVDETRYIEVAREFLPSRPLTLHLNGLPYAHKPPLAFWIAGLLHALGLRVELALRLVPVLATSATCVLVARLGRRIGLRHAEWVFAATLLPLGYAQVLLLDPLLVFAVWLALDAWWHGRDAGAAAGAALAFLAKGPVAALFLLPLGLALAPLRPRERARAAPLVDAAWSLLALAWLLDAAPRLQAVLGAEARAPVVAAWVLLVATAAACVLAAMRTRLAAPARLFADVGQGATLLAAWAFGASLRGGATFARDLLVHQTRDRLSESFAHSQPIWFYAPILLVGLLPALPALVFARPAGVPLRVLAAAAAALACLSLVDQKQPHYLLPLAPAFALVVAQAVEMRPSALRAWQTGVRWMLGLLLVLVAIGWPLVVVFAPSRYGYHAHALSSSPTAWLTWGFVAAACSLCIAQLGGTRIRLDAYAATFLLGFTVLALPVHRALDLLTTPRDLMASLREAPGSPVATFRCFQGGYFNWLGARDQVTRIEEPEALDEWCARHPDGLVLSYDKDSAELADLSLRRVVQDRYRGRGIELHHVELHASFP